MDVDALRWTRVMLSWTTYQGHPQLPRDLHRGAVGISGGSMPLYTIWREGYAVSGSHGEAQVMGTAEAANFPAACLKLLGDDPAFDPARLTYWACQLHDNETAARASFS